MPGWATDIRSGSADEPAQAVHFVVSVDHPELFPTRTTIATLAPIDRKAVNEDVFPGLEQISLVAVK